MTGREDPGARVPSGMAMDQPAEVPGVGEGAGAGHHPPSLDEVLTAAHTLAGALIRTLGRQFTGAPDRDVDPCGPDEVDRHLGAAVADVRSAQEELRKLAALLHPTNHLVIPGEGAVTPGAAAAPAASASGGGSPDRTPVSPPFAVGAGADSGPRFDVPRPGAGQPFASGTAFLAAQSVSLSLHRRSR